MCHRRRAGRPLLVGEHISFGEMAVASWYSFLPRSTVDSEQDHVYKRLLKTFEFERTQDSEVINLANAQAIEY